MIIQSETVRASVKAVAVKREKRARFQKFRKYSGMNLVTNGVRGLKQTPDTVLLSRGIIEIWGLFGTVLTSRNCEIINLF